jgi:FlaA1/EpsC-like NDP-sugar epimerase
MSHMNQINRRNFLKSSLLTGAAIGLPVHSWAQVPGANNDIRVAIVGFNGQGKNDLEEFRRVPGVRVVALCDVDKDVLQREVKKFKDRNEPVETYSDVRKLLENKNIDAISIATPNHWHALIAIWAIQAGKDVYVQKPVSHNVSEGRRIVEAARKYKKMVQTGTQSRSSPSGQPRKNNCLARHLLQTARQYRKSHFAPANSSEH